MISQETLDVLRCPMDPGNTRLEATETALVCQRCRVEFPIREGIPCLLIEEAVLPQGCASISQLPCQQGKKS
jgi:uncharacterized protein YbaR (Trm112 family)